MNPAINQQNPKWLPTLIAITLCLAWVGYAYWGTLESMAQIWWRSETYTHGLVVPPITLWLIWHNRDRLATLQPQATLWLIVPLAAMVFSWLLGELTAVNALTQFSVIGIIVLAVMSLVGIQVSKTLAFPLLFLFFSVPIGDFLMPLLMEWTADFTVLAVRMSGVPVYREGQNFVIPSGHWSVVEACSGIRYLIASLTVGTLYAYLTYTSLTRRLAFILVSLLVPVVANWLRAYLIVMLGHLSGNKLAAGVDHLIYGWVFFGVVIAIMFLIGMRWAEHSDATKIDSQFAFVAKEKKSPWLATLVLGFFIAAGPLAESTLRQANSTTPVKLVLPESLGRWQSTPAPIYWQPSFANPTTELHTAYASEDNWVGLYIAYYRNQNFEKKLITSSNVLTRSDDPTWHVIPSKASKATISGSEFPTREGTLLQKTGGLDDRYSIRQWYWVNGHLTDNDIKAKLLTAWAMLSGHGDDSATVIIYTPLSIASQALPVFINDWGLKINQALTQAQQQ